MLGKWGMIFVGPFPPGIVYDSLTNIRFNRYEPFKDFCFAALARYLILNGYQREIAGFILSRYLFQWKLMI